MCISSCKDRHLSYNLFIIFNFYKLSTSKGIENSLSDDESSN